MASVSSVFRAQKFQFKIKTNLSTEARIKLNFGKLPETTAKVTAKTISLQNLHISGHIEIHVINIKKLSYFTFSRTEVSVSPVSTAEFSLQAQLSF